MMKSHRKFGLKPLATAYDLPHQLLDLLCVLISFSHGPQFLNDSLLRLAFFSIAFLAYCKYELSSVAIFTVVICIIVVMFLLLLAYGKYSRPDALNLMKVV